MVTSDVYLDKLILNERQGSRFYAAYAVVLFCIGFTIVIGSNVLSKQLNIEALKSLLSLGGTFISSLSAFPLKEIQSRRERAQLYEGIKMRLLALQQKRGAADKAERQKIDDLVWQIIQKVALPGI